MGQPGTGDGGFSSPAAQGSGLSTPAAGGNTGTSDGGFGAPVSTTSSSKGGGGGLFHSLSKDLGGVGHWIGTKAAKAVPDVKQIGTGIYDIGKAAIVPGKDPNVGAEWKALFSGHPIRSWQIANKSAYGRSQTGAISSLTKGQYEAYKTAVEHPGRDPFMDVVLAAPLAHTVAKGGLLAAGKGALLREPRLVSEPGREGVSLYSSHNAARRLVQAGIDKAVNHALANERSNGFLGHEGPVANYGRARMGGTVADYARSSIRYRQAMIAGTRAASRGVQQFAKSIKTDVADPTLTAQAILHSLHDNVLPEHEAIFHEHQAAKGVNPEQNHAWAQAFNDAAKLNVVHRGEDNRVTVDPSHPLAEPLSKADDALSKLGAYSENEIVARGLRDPLALEDRRGRVSQIVQRGNPLQTEPQVLKDAKRSVVKAQITHERNLKGEADWRNGNGQKSLNGDRVAPGPNRTLGGKLVEGTPENSNPWRNKVVLSGQKLEEAQQRLRATEDRHGFSSPQRRIAQQQGIQAREAIAAAAHKTLGDAAPERLAQIEAFARQYARTHDVTPHEFYANHLSEAAPDEMLQKALHATRESLSPVVQEIARRMYAPHGWDEAAKEHFVSDMERAANGEHVPPDVQHLFLMTHDYAPGRGYVPMSIWEDNRQSNAPIASAPGPIVGEPKQPLNSHTATGEATAQGLRRTDVAEAVTAHVQKIFRYFNTVDHRDLAAKYGSDTRMSKDDVLVRYDRRTEAGFKLPAQRVDEAVKEALGILENKTALPDAEEEGLSAGVSAVLHDLVGDLFPSLGSDQELRRVQETAARGDKAPAGYKWVPQQVARLKDLEATITRNETGKIGRFADNTNGAITAATVYYKIGHFFTRYFTNAATNFMQGSAAPWQVARSVDLWRSLTEDEQREALAYAGTHYYEAAPGATGSTFVGRGMQKGLHVPFTDIALRTKSGEAVMSPQFWAHHVDAPFRFNSIAFEARQAGYEGVEGFRQFLQDVRGYKGLDVAERARVDGVLRRADREAIAYDRLNSTEKKYLTRAIWFYPWIKGSTVFTANSFLEHPFKFAQLVGLGHQSAEQEQSLLGDMPSYAQGLTNITKGEEPVISDFNTFNPFSTAADLADIPEHIGNAAGMANPVYQAGLNTAESVNPYGVHTKTPITDNLKGLLASAPEYQIAEGGLNGGDQSHKLYPGGHGLNPLYKNWLGELLRSLGGPATPRHVNPAAGHSLAQRERSGR